MTQRIVFTWSQCWDAGSDPVTAGDLDAISRAAAALAPLRGKYDLCLLLNPSHADDTKLWAALDRMVACGFGFVFDAVSSDTALIPANAKRTNGNTSWTSPWNMAYGVARIPGSNGPGWRGIYDSIWSLWPANFYGFRFHEVGTMAWAQVHQPAWFGANLQFMPWDGLFQRAWLEPFVAWSQKRFRLVYWNEPVLVAMGNPDRELIASETAVKQLAGAYANTVRPCFATNVAGPTVPPARFLPWLRGLQSAGMSGGAVSVQPTWTGQGGLPTPVAVDWCRQVLREGLDLLIEPAWWAFNLPWGGVGGHPPYALANSGAATPALLALIAAL